VLDLHEKDLFGRLVAAIPLLTNQIFEMTSILGSDRLTKVSNTNAGTEQLITNYVATLLNSKKEPC